MQKISLKVLLRFLSSYTHWNLVRRAECYHLYFVTGDSVGLTQFPSPRWREKEKKARRKGSKLMKDSITDVIPAIRKQRALAVETPAPSNKKDVFLFSPIFQSAEQAVSVGLGGLEQSLDEEKSKRSSLTSLVWDDECDFTAPYQEDGESGEQDYDSESSYDTIGESDSNESTPKERVGQLPSEDKVEWRRDVSVRSQGDRLLREMLQLRRDIELDLSREGVETGATGSSMKEMEDLVPGLEVGKAEENMLRERLEQMTVQIKKEMAEEKQKKVEENHILEASRNSPLANGHGDECVKNSDHSDREIVNAETILTNRISAHQENNSCTEVEDALQISSPKEINVEEKEDPSNTVSHFPVINNAKELNDNELPKDKSPHLLAKDHEETSNLGISITVPVGDIVNVTSVSKRRESINGSDQLQVRERRVSKSRSPSAKVDTLKRKKKLKKSGETAATVEIPFCSHNQHLTGQDQAAFLKSLDRKKTKKVTKPLLSTVLSPADRLGAEQILHELLEIRESKSQTQNDPVLDTMISVIQLSSTNLSLPAPTSGGAGIQFKELFDFEVNFSESREAFAKLAGGDGKHTVQELFPWTTGSSDSNNHEVFKKLRGSMT